MPESAERPSEIAHEIAEVQYAIPPRLSATLYVLQIMPGMKANGNRVQYLTGDTLGAKIDLIRQAQDSIYISMLSMYKGEKSKYFIDELIAAKNRRPAVDIRIMVDNIGLTNLAGQEQFSDAEKDRINAHGIRFLQFYNGPFVRHEKLVIMDGRKLITGGTNVGDGYSDAGRDRTWHDQDFLIDGPICATVHNEYINQWYCNVIDNAWKSMTSPLSRSIPVFPEDRPSRLHFIWAEYKDTNQARENYDAILRAEYGIDKEKNIFYEQYMESHAEEFERCYGLKSFRAPFDTTGADSLPGKILLSFLWDAPYLDAGDPSHDTREPGMSTSTIVDAHLKALDHTQLGEEVLLWAPYFVASPQFVAHAQAALDRGVRLKILANSEKSTDEKTTSIALVTACLDSAQTLLSHSLFELYLWQMPSTMHRKGALYGTDLIVITSDNQDSIRGAWDDKYGFSSECAFVVAVNNQECRDLQSQLRTEFYEDLACAKRVTPEILADYARILSGEGRPPMEQLKTRILVWAGRNLQRFF